MFQTGSHYIDQASFKLKSFLSQPPVCQDYRHTPLSSLNNQTFKLNCTASKRLKLYHYQPPYFSLSPQTNISLVFCLFAFFIFFVVVFIQIHQITFLFRGGPVHTTSSRTEIDLFPISSCVYFHWPVVSYSLWFCRPLNPSFL